MNALNCTYRLKGDINQTNERYIGSNAMKVHIYSCKD